MTPINAPTSARSTQHAAREARMETGETGELTRRTVMSVSYASHWCKDPRISQPAPSLTLAYPRLPSLTLAQVLESRPGLDLATRAHAHATVETAPHALAGKQANRRTRIAVRARTDAN